MKVAAEMSNDDKTVTGAKAGLDEEDVETVRGAMVEALLDSKREEGEQLYERLKLKHVSEVERKSDRLHYLAALFSGGLDQGALSEMRALEEDPEIASLAHEMIDVSLTQAGLAREAGAIGLVGGASVKQPVATASK